MYLQTRRNYCSECLSGVRVFDVHFSVFSKRTENMEYYNKSIRSTQKEFHYFLLPHYASLLIHKDNSREHFYRKLKKKELQRIIFDMIFSQKKIKMHYNELCVV